MVSRDELIAIVGGSLAGLVVLMVTVAICIYCCCGRKKESKKNLQRFQPLSAGNDSSKHSTLNGMDPRADIRSADPRLPKVGGGGVWMGRNPSMYAQPPPHNQYVGDRHGKRSSSLQRSSSEDRLNQGRGHHGHPVYAGGNLHLYHSNPYNYYDPYSMPGSNYLNMYGGYPPYHPGSNRDSRAMLVEYPDGHEFIYDPYRDVEDRRHGKKVKRTHSDLTGTKRKKREKRRESPFEGRQNRSTDMLDKAGSSNRTASVEVHQRRSRYNEPAVVQVKEQRQPKEMSEQVATIEIHDTELSECATDSAKIRAMQGKTIEPEPISMKWPAKDDLRLDLPSDINDDITDDIQVKHYQYDGQYKNRGDKTDQAVKNGYTNSAFVENEVKESIVHKRLEKRESNTDGKQVSAAFDFLNNYMSDDEDTVFTDSRRQSPLPLDT